MDAKFFSSIQKYKKSNTIGFESVPLNIEFGFFGTKKEHTFFGFPHIPKQQKNTEVTLTLLDVPRKNAPINGRVRSKVLRSIVHN